MARHIGWVLFGLIWFVVSVIGAFARAKFDPMSSGVLLAGSILVLVMSMIRAAADNCHDDMQEWENREFTPHRPGKVYPGQETSPSNPERKRSLF